MLVVGQGDELHAGIGKSFLCHRETVCVAGHHANDLAACLTDGLYGFQRTASRGDKVFHDDHLLARLQVAFNQVLHAMIFRFRPYIDEGHVQRIGHEGSLCDGSCSHTGYDVGIGEVFENGVDNAQLDVVAQVGIRERLTVVAIEG